MDSQAIAILKQAKIDTTLSTLSEVMLRLSDSGKVEEIGEEVPLLQGKAFALVRLKPISELFVGTRQPRGDVNPEPSSPYILLFAMLEKTALSYCNVTRTEETDKEFERLYRQLRRRPDGKDPHPLFSYLHAVCRLYMSMRDLSQAEFEAVAQRLSRSARTFSTYATSRNYLAQLRAQFEGGELPRP